MIDRAGRVETVSAGLLREAGLARSQMEGRRLNGLFSGDLVDLFNAFIEKGFFDGAIESAESVDRYCFAISHGKRDIGPVHGLHWPHRVGDGSVRWMLTGARVSPQEFDLLRQEWGGRVAFAGGSGP